MPGPVVDRIARNDLASTFERFSALHVRSRREAQALAT